MSKRKPIVLAPGGGRSYPMGRIQAIFKADGEETQGRYSVSEWWLEADTTGPGAHAHSADDEIFYVIAGTMSFLVDDEWEDAVTGSFVLVPAGVTHDFENRGSVQAGILNISTQGGFEANMLEIAAWFEANPARSTERG